MRFVNLLSNTNLFNSYRRVYVLGSSSWQKCSFRKNHHFTMSVRDQPDPKNAGKHRKTYARAACAPKNANCDEYTCVYSSQFAFFGILRILIAMRKCIVHSCWPKNANSDEYTHSRWHQFAMKSQFTSNLRTDFGTYWGSNSLISAQNSNSRAICALVLAHIATPILSFQPKMAIHK